MKEQQVFPECQKRYMDSLVSENFILFKVLQYYAYREQEFRNDNQLNNYYKLQISPDNPQRQQFITKMRREDRSTYNRSPRRELQSELQEHSNKIKELLRHDLNMLEEENAILKTKCKKVTELEDRVEIVLRQNSDLLAENEKLSKLLHQKKSEFEVLKNKYDATMAHRLGTTAEHQFERKKLLNQIEHLRSQLQETERGKNMQIGQIKSQHQIQLQSIRRQSVTGQQVYEQEIRKLRQQLQKREFENNDTLNRLKRLSSESEYEILRLKQEKEKLRNELLYNQAERKKDIETLKSKLEMNYIEQIQILKKNHMSGIDSVETENFRLKEYLESRTREVDDLANKNAKQKAHFEETISLLRKQNESIRMKMLQGERFSELEIDNLKGKLHEMHEVQIQQMKINHQRYVECLQSQLKKLENTIKSKNEEIEQLIKQKTAVRQMFQTEVGRLKEEIESLVVKNRQLENKMRQNEDKAEIKLKQKQDHIAYLDQLNNEQRENSDRQLNALRQIIEHQKNELEKEKIAFRQKQQSLKQSLSQYKNESEALKDQLRRQKVDKQRKIDELKNELEATTTQLTTKADTGKTKITILEREAESLKKTIQLKQREVRNLQQRIRSSDQRQKKLEKEVEQLRVKLVKRDQKSNEMLQEQKQRLENSFNYTLQNLKSDHDSAIKLEQAKLNDANEKLKKKQRQLDDLLRAYKKMKEQLQILTEQEANKKELTLKFPGATSDLIATKNLFDVYLKTKVLDVCGDAIQNKQNR